jgi:hypothetical protein
VGEEHLPDQITAAAHACLLEDVLEMSLDGVGGDDEVLGDLDRRVALQNPLGHGLLPFPAIQASVLAAGKGSAALYPKLVTSLTVLSMPDPDAMSAAIADPRSPQHAASRYMTTLSAAGSQHRILAHGVKGFKALFALGGGGLPATMVDVYARAMVTPAALGAAIDWYRANPFPTPRLGPIKVPTLYLWGAKDSVFLRSTANATAAYVNAPYTFCVLSGQGHWLPEDAAEQIVPPLLSQLAGSRLRCPSISTTHRTH